jgi:hypothetical protein
MSVVIRSLSTRCRVPRPLEGVARVVDTAMGDGLAAELSARLGPSLDRVPGVVRIRQLPLRVVVRAAELTPAGLREAWATSFLRALFEAMACPPGEGRYEVARYESRARQLAAFVAAVFAARTGDWQFAGFAGSALAAAPAQVFDVCTEPGELRELLAALDEERVLEPLLLRAGELELERLIIRLSAGGEVHAPQARELPAAAAMLAAWQRASGTSSKLRGAMRGLARPGEGLPVATRRLALRLFAFTLAAEDAPAPAMPLRALFESLLVLAAVVEGGTLHGAAELLAAQHAPQPVRDFVERLRCEPRARELDQLAQAVGDADAPVAPAALAAQPEEERWLASPVASIFLLAPIVQRLGWASRRHDPELGPRGLAFLLIAAAHHVLHPGEERPVDPAVALFGGCLGDLDNAAFRAFAGSREQEVASLAETLVTEFRLRVRGFREAPLPSVVRQFLARPGRIRLEERRITAVLDASPYHVALHLSGADDPVGCAEWLDGRAVELVLKGI